MGRKVAAIASALLVVALLFAGFLGVSRPTGGVVGDAWREPSFSLPTEGGSSADGAQGEGAASGAADEAFHASGGGESESGYEPGVVLVRLRDGVTVAQFNESLASLDYIATEKVSEDDVALGYVELELADGVSVKDAETRIAAEGVVAAAQPNYRYSLTDDEVAGYSGADDATWLVRAVIAQVASVDDELAGEQWALDSVNAYEAWDTVKAGDAGDARVTVAVIDNGCLVTHEDLENNIVDSYNAVDGSGDVAPKYGGHGTHVCGIIAAEANNGRGVAGVSYNAGLLPIQVFERLGQSKSTASSASLCKAYAYVLDRAEELNIRVVNMSLGATNEETARDDVFLDSDDEAVIDAVTRAYDGGILTVCSAGNDAGKLGRAYFNYPSDWLDCALGVIALDSSGARANYSNYNMERQATKDIAAPGGTGSSYAESVLSTWSTGSYTTSNGTSMAAPYVAGVAALAFAVNPRLSAGDVAQLLCETAADLGEAGWDAEYGYGEVDAAAAVSKAALFPEGPSELLKGSAVQLALSGGDDWIWSSSDESVATVDDDGVVTGVGAGTAEITARSKSNGAYATLPKSVTVYDVGFTGSGTVEVGESVELGFDESPDTGLWLVASANDDIATVSVGDGVTVTGVAVGETSVTATLATNRDLVVEFPVSVVPAALEEIDALASLSEATKASSSVALADQRAIYSGSPIAYRAEGVTWTGSRANVKFAYYSDEACTRTAVPLNAGTYYVRATLPADADHYGAVSRVAKLVVSPASLSGAKVTLSVAKRAYNGKFQKGSVRSVVLGSTPLGTGDFSVSAKRRKSVGTASVTVAGKGNYTGTVKVPYTIVKAAQSISAKNTAVRYTGKKHGKTKVLASQKTISLKVRAKVAAKTTVNFAKANKAGGSKIAVNKRTGKMTVKKGLRKGTYKVKVKLTAASSANYRAAKSKTIAVKIVVK